MRDPDERDEEPEPAKPVKPAKAEAAKGKKADPDEVDLGEPDEEAELEEPELDVPDIEVAEEEVEPEPPPLVRVAPLRAPKVLPAAEPEGLQQGFSPRALKIMADVRALAERLGHDAATTGHLLAVILAVDTWFLQDVFVDVNAFPDMFEEEMARLREVPPSPQGYWVDAGLEAACRRAREAVQALDHAAVEPEHLALSLLSLPAGTAADILEEFSLDRADMQEEIVNLMGYAMEDLPDWEAQDAGRRSRKRKR